MERSLADLVVFDVIPLARTALKETAELTAALQGLARELQQLTTELAEGELPEVRKLLAVLLSQLGCPYELEEVRHLPRRRPPPLRREAAPLRGAIRRQAVQPQRR